MEVDILEGLNTMIRSQNERTILVGIKCLFDLLFSSQNLSVLNYLTICCRNVNGLLPQL